MVVDWLFLILTILLLSHFWPIGKLFRFGDTGYRPHDIITPCHM